MTAGTLFLAAVGAVALLLVLVTRVRLPAFLALLLTAFALALVSGTAPGDVIQVVQDGMAGTLGYIAVVIGLGAMIGALLERSGGARAIADTFVRRLGNDRAPYGLLATGLVVATPVFFDVALVLLVPFAYATSRAAGRPLLLYALPLLAGIMVGHTFIPPTPGPVAVAALIGADLGRVVLVGLLAGIPAALVASTWWTRRVATRVFPDLEALPEIEERGDRSIGAVSAVGIVLVPLLLILVGTVYRSFIGGDATAGLGGWIAMVTHPFSALAVGLIGALVVGARQAGIARDDLARICNKGLEPVGLIILVTGAGGVLGKVLVAAGADQIVAELASGSGLPVLFLAFAAAALVRIVQGSATVSMVTAGGLVAPFMLDASGWLPALVTIAIAAGASVVSHVNDSGFWLVSRYVGLTETDTFRAWTTLSTVVGVTGFVAVLLISLVLA